jgi:hypothetical protein
VQNAPISCYSDPTINSGACSVIYRRSFDDNTMISSGLEGLTVSALPTDNPIENAGVINLSIIPAKDSHPVQSITSCSGGPGVTAILHNINLYPNSLDPTHVNKLQIKTAQHLDAPNGTTVTCQFVVFDVDPNPTFNQDGCPYLSAHPTWCVTDNGDAHPPLGGVTFVDQNDVAIPGQSGTCATNGLGHQGARPTGTFTGTTPNTFGVPFLTGQPEYASWCSVTMVLQSGVNKLSATYNGEVVPSGFIPHTPLSNGQTNPIDVTLH